MAVGALDGNGVWQYGESDQRDTFSALLNIGQDSTSDAIGSAKARIAALENTGVTGGVTGGIFVSATGFNVSAHTGRRKSGLAFIDFTFSRTGAAITVPANGDFANIQVATFSAGWVPASGHRYPTPSSERLAGLTISSNGLFLQATQAGIALATGDVFSGQAVYPLA